MVAPQDVGHPDEQQREDDLLDDHPERVEARDRGDHEGHYREDLAEEAQARVRPPVAGRGAPGEVVEREGHREHHEGAEPDGGGDRDAVLGEGQGDGNGGRAHDGLGDEDPPDPAEGPRRPRVVAHVLGDDVARLAPGGDPIETAEQLVHRCDPPCLVSGRRMRPDQGTT